MTKKDTDKCSGQPSDVQKTVLELSPPARQRKQPKQSRSVALVDAIKIAARKILEEEGRQALTLHRLAEDAGVAVSSIYEYFPAIEALVTAVFVDSWDELRGAQEQAIASLPADATLYDGLEIMVRELLHMQQQLALLDPEAAIKYLQYNELSRLKLIRAEAQPRSGITQALMQRFAAEVSAGDPDKLIFLALQTIQALFRVLVLEKPHYLGEEDTVTMIARMLHGLLTAPVSSPSVADER